METRFQCPHCAYVFFYRDCSDVPGTNFPPKFCPDCGTKWEAEPLTEQQWNKLLDDLLRQVVCDCGNCRHHGVDWMPEGSGEGKSVAKRLITDFILRLLK